VKLVSRCLVAVCAALAIGSCSRQIDYLREGALNPPSECGYDEAVRAEQDAADKYGSAPEPPPNASAEAKAAFDQLRQAKDAAERAKADAQQCEDDAREWSDLRAQWQNSRAAINIAALAETQIALTAFEILLLIATVVGGIASLLLSRQALVSSENERRRQEQQFHSQLRSARQGIAESRRVAEQQTRAYVLPVAATFSWPENEMPEFVITYRNAGQTPAINVSECILFSSDERPPLYDHHRAFAEKPIIGGDTLNAATTIPPTMHAKLSSRAIGKTIKDGGDIWAYVFYKDVFGNTFATGARLSSRQPFVMGGRDEDMSVNFEDEASFFFEEIKFDRHGRALPYSFNYQPEPQLEPTPIDGEENQ
jgi:hypothetical protein